MFRNVLISRYFVSYIVQRTQKIGIGRAGQVPQYSAVGKRRVIAVKYQSNQGGASLCSLA